MILPVDWLGHLNSFGLAEGYIVMSIQDRQIRDAKTFAALAVEEWERKKKEGGALKLVVKTGDTPPLTYNKPIDKEIGPRIRRGGGGGNRGGGRSPNIWQQTGGGSRGSRDDPTQ